MQSGPVSSSQMLPTHDRQKTPTRPIFSSVVLKRSSWFPRYRNTWMSASMSQALPTTQRLRYVPGAWSQVLEMVGRNGSLPWSR